MISQITAAGIRPGQPRQVDPRLGLPGALEHAARACLEREHVTGLDEVLGLERGSIATWIVCARSWAEMPGRDSLTRLHGHREGRLEGRLVLCRHQVQAQLIAALGRQRQADQPAGLARHEVDVLRGRELRGEGEVALVLAVLGVADHDHLAGADVLERLLDRCESGVVAHRDASGLTSFSTYFASTSTSRLTRRPESACVRLVRSRVSGISATEKPVAVQRRHGEADAVHGDRALLDDVPHQPRAGPAPARCFRRRPASPTSTVPTPSTWPWTMWPPSRSDGPQRKLEIHQIARPQGRRERCAPASQRTGRRRTRPPEVNRRQADPVDHDRVALPKPGSAASTVSRAPPTAAIDAGDPTKRLNKPGEHLVQSPGTCDLATWRPTTP